MNQGTDAMTRTITKAEAIMREKWRDLSYEAQELVVTVYTLAVLRRIADKGMEK